jgi:protein-L-isoaspartate(D-aspartate) O-methyltransferase
MLDFAQARRNMVDCQIRTWDVTDRAVIDAFDTVPRERFVPESLAEIAYLDRELTVSRDAATGEQRTTLTPMVHARLVQAASIGPEDAALDVACGLGLSTAVLARIARSVVGVESIRDLADGAAQRLAAAGIANARVVRGDLAMAGGESGPFDAVLVNGSLEARPDALLDRLRAGGRLVAVMGHGRSGRATLFLRTGSGVSERTLFDAAAPALWAFREAPAFVF